MRPEAAGIFLLYSEFLLEPTECFDLKHTMKKNEMEAKKEKSFINVLVIPLWISMKINLHLWPNFRAYIFF